MCRLVCGACPAAAGPSEGVQAKGPPLGWLEAPRAGGAAGCRAADRAAWESGVDAPPHATASGVGRAMSAHRATAWQVIRQRRGGVARFGMSVLPNLLASPGVTGVPRPLGVRLRSGSLVARVGSSRWEGSPCRHATAGFCHPGVASGARGGRLTGRWAKPSGLRRLNRGALPLFAARVGFGAGGQGWWPVAGCWGSSRRQSAG
jgi:hypothetical protein